MAAKLSDGLLDPVQLAIVAAGLSRQYGVRVTVSGSDTATTTFRDGEVTINLPAVSSDDPAFPLLVRGYIDHEVGHVRFTDHEAISKVFGHEASDIQMQLLNILEDVYVERRMAGLYKGCGYNLTRISKYLFTEDVQAKSRLASKGITVKRTRSSKPATVEPIGQILMWVLYQVRGQANPACGITPEILRSLDDGLKERGLDKIADKLRPIIARVPAEGTSTEANAKLAKELYDALDNASGNAHKDDLMSGAFSNPDADVQSKANDRDEVTASIASDRCTQHTITRALDDVRNAGLMPTTAVGIASMASRSIERAVDTTVNASKRMESSGQDGKVDTRLANFNRIHWDKNGAANYSFDSSPKYLQMANRISGRLACRLQSLLQAYVMNRSGIGRSGGVDTHRLHRIAVNDARVFTRREIRRGMNTEFVILCDASGSMNDRVIPADGITSSHIMGYAVYSIMKALRTLPGMKSSAYAFYGSVMREMYGKGEQIRKPVLPRATGGTPLAESLIQMVPVFELDPLSRKVVIVLTDGWPDDRDTAKIVINRMRNMGFVVATIGIGTSADALGAMFTDCADDFASVCNLEDMDRLPDTLCSTLRKHTIKGGL